MNLVDKKKLIKDNLFRNENTGGHCIVSEAFNFCLVFFGIHQDDLSAYFS